MGEQALVLICAAVIAAAPAARGESTDAAPVSAPEPAPGLGLPDPRSPTAASQPAREGALPAQGELRSPPAPDTAPAPAAVPCPEDTCSAETEVLSGLLSLFDPWAPAPERVHAAERLGAGGDGRAAEPLAFALVDREQPVRLAAAQALGNFPGETARRALKRSLLDGHEEDAVREAAIGALGRHGAEEAAEVLWSARADLPSDLRLAAESVLRERYAEFVQARGGLAPIADASGRWMMVTAGGGFGGFTMGVLADLAGADDNIPLSVLGGVILGAGTPWLLTLDSGMTLGDALVISSSGVWGILLADLTLDLFQPPRFFKDSRTGEDFRDFQGRRERDDNLTNADQWGWLAGETIGLAAGVLGAPRLRFTAGDAIFTDLGGMAGSLLASGALLQLQPREDERAGTAVVLGAALASLASSGYLAPKLRYSWGDRSAIALATAWGAWTGPWLVTLLRKNETGDQVGGGLLLGSALGFGVGSALGHFKEPTLGDVGFVTLGSVLGTMVGAGVGLLASGNDDRVTAAMLTTGWAALGGSVALADNVKFTGGDAVVVGLGLTWGLWQGIGIPLAFTAEDGGMDRRVGGGFLVGTAVGGAGAAALAQGLDLTPYEGLMVASGGVWGSWLGGWSVIALQKDQGRNALRAAVVGGDAGLALTAALLAAGVDPAKMGWVNLAGAAGMAIGTSVATIAAQDRISAGNVIGSIVGLVGGTILVNVL